VRIVETANPEEEAQAIALLVRQAVAEPEKRVAVVTPDRGLAIRVVHHLRRWNIEADDSAGRALSQTAAGRLFLLLTEVAAEAAAPVPLLALLEHPLVRLGDARGGWLDKARAFELELRGPRPAPGLASLRQVAVAARAEDWWREVEAILAPLMAVGAASFETGSQPSASIPPQDERVKNSNPVRPEERGRSPSVSKDQP
jgi:ATP-dependent helicase/nuclease subunit B